MSTVKPSKINKLVKQWPRGTVGTAAHLKSWGYSYDLLKKYKESGWIDSFGRGAYILSGDKVEWLGALFALQSQLGLNIHAGGKLRQAEITKEHLQLAEIVRPKLVQDGMFLVGLDIVGDKLMEINVFSPGGLGSAQRFEKVNFNLAVLDALERKVEYMGYYRRNFDNDEMATL